MVLVHVMVGPQNSWRIAAMQGPYDTGACKSATTEVLAHCDRVLLKFFTEHLPHIHMTPDDELAHKSTWSNLHWKLDEWMDQQGNAIEM